MKKAIFIVAVSVASSFAGLLTQTFDHLTKNAGKTQADALSTMSQLAYLTPSDVETINGAIKLNIEPKLVLGSIEKARAAAKKAAK